jgi:hypothetical protein
MVSHLFYEKRHESALKREERGRGGKEKAPLTLVEN